MTSRCRWILAITICGMLIGVLNRLPQFAILNLTFILWIGLDWFVFRYKTTAADQVFKKAKRSIKGNSGAEISIAIHESCPVILKANFLSHAAGLRYFLSDHIPAGIESNDQFPAVIDVRSDQTMQWKYTLTPRVTGRTTLPGIQVTITDKLGLFRQQKFYRLAQNITLLPFLLQPKTTMEKIKGHNIQLRSGHHRYKRPGISSELLGIREYQPGDPPKSIAWKATARTGQLMTCEYESAVPIRATVIADVSHYQFWGRPGPSAFDQISSAVGSITRLCLEDKDPVGAVFISGEHKTTIRPGLGQRQLVRVLQTLLNAHPVSTTSNEYELPELEQVVWRSLYRLFPQLVTDQINRPIIPTLLYGPRRRFQYATRKQAALVLNWIQNGPIHHGYKLVYDDVLFRNSCNRFFTDYPTAANALRLVENYGNGRSEKNKNVLALARSLMEQVARAKDNELFLLVGDFHVNADSYCQLVNSIRFARANYHRVMIINVPPKEMANFIEDPVARQAFQYLEDQNMKDETNHYKAILELGATIALLDDVKLLDRVTAELHLLKTGGSRGAANPVFTGS